MFKLCLIAAFVGIASALPLNVTGRSGGRIVGGEVAHIRDVPYQVSITVEGSHNCGGSIISHEWVVTAAHCMHYDLDDLAIRVASDSSSGGGIIRKIDKFVIHELFEKSMYGTPSNDIALLHMSEPFEFDDNHGPIALFEQDEEAVPGRYAVVSGWGSTGTNLTDELRAVTVPIVSKKACKEAYEDMGGVPEGEICAGLTDGGKDACQGDSGGPLVIGGRLAGIVSWGRGCALPNYPGVYTEVAHYRDWVFKTSGV